MLPVANNALVHAKLIERWELCTTYTASRKQALPANSSLTAFIKSYCTSIRCINYGSSDKKEIARFESCGYSSNWGYLFLI